MSLVSHELNCSTHSMSHQGCVPSKALIRAAKAIREVRRSAEFGVVLPGATINDNDDEQPTIGVDFAKIMRRLRAKRAQIAPADGHDGTTGTGAHVYQGRGVFTGPDTIQVTLSGKGSNDDGSDATNQTVQLKFKTAVIATGGRPMVPTDIPGLADAPYTTNEILFNLQTLPPRMVILGSGVVALEMAQCFATFGSHVTVLQRSATLFSGGGDTEAATIVQAELERSGVHFVSLARVTRVETVRERNPTDTTQHPLMRLVVATKDSDPIELECECLLVATGRLPNIEHLGLEQANVEYKDGAGIVVNDKAQSVSNPKVYAVGDCVAGVPRLTHMSGEMAKLVVQNSLFQDNWKLSSLVVPAVMYTEPEYATVGLSSEEMARQKGIDVDVYRGGMEHNDRAILDSANVGFCKIFCRRGTDEIVGATIVAERAGEMINEVSLALKNNIGLRAIGRNIHVRL
jgi:pyruvate/2-oxoglutarate dehydrogenase complex dihydrolipoamide dehydrogenase (E3) component